MPVPRIVLRVFTLSLRLLDGQTPTASKPLRKLMMVPVYPAGFRRDTNVRFLQVFRTAGEAYSEEPGCQTAFDGVLRITLGPWEAKAYYAEYPEE